MNLKIGNLKRGKPKSSWQIFTKAVVADGVAAADGALVHIHACTDIFSGRMVVAILALATVRPLKSNK